MINIRILVERDYKTEIAQELEIKRSLYKIRDYTSNWIGRVNRKLRDRL
jgi:hypothetical protein